MAVRKIKLSPLSQENGNLTNNNLSERRRNRNLIRDNKGNSTLIDQTAEQVQILASSVSTVEGRVSTAEQLITPTAITQTVRSSTEYTNDLGAKVSTNEVISRINQSAEAIKIQAGKVDISGLVTISALSTAGQTIINGSNITTGTISADRINFDNAVGNNVNLTGTITADSGSIAGFSLIPNYGTIVSGASGRAITGGSGSTRVGMSPALRSPGGFDYAFWAGNNNPQLAPFRVLNNGEFRSSNAFIGGWQVGGSTISRGNLSLDASSGNGSINIGGAVLSSNSANRLNISGHLDVPGLITVGAVGNSLVPTADNLHSLGTQQLRWHTVWTSTSAVNGSDLRLKEEIKEIDFANDFILNLNPVQFKLINGQSGRKHYGFIAQEVKETMTKVGIDDFGGYVDPNTTKGEDEEEQMLGLRYEEFIAPMVATIQHLEKRIRELEAKAS